MTFQRLNARLVLRTTTGKSVNLWLYSLNWQKCSNSSITIIIIIIIIMHKAAGVKIKLSKNNNPWPRRVSHSIECSQEGDRIPPLKHYT